MNDSLGSDPVPSIRSIQRNLDAYLQAGQEGDDADQKEFMPLMTTLFTVFIAIARRVLFLAVVVLPATAIIIRMMLFVKNRVEEIRCISQDGGFFSVKVVVFALQCMVIVTAMYLFMTVYMPVVRLELKVLVSVISTIRHLF